MRLFLARGASARPGAGAAAPVAVVARICRELDGLPLAIELAAARTSVLSAEEIEAHLADKFRFLAWRRPVADPRHQTLKAAIGWSYDLLSAEERRAFGELSVFAGGFTLAAAAAVCCAGDEAAALDLVDQLAAKSLLVAEPAAAGTRYRLLETIRQYAAECLAETGEAGQARLRHAEAFLRLAEEERELAVLAARAGQLPRRPGLHAIGRQPGRAAAGPVRWAASGWPADCSRRHGAGWNARWPAGPADPRLHADLHRLLGAVLYAAGDLERAQAALAQGVQVAADGRPVLGSGPDPGPAGGHPGLRKAGPCAEAFQACDAAAAVLESDGDLEGAAEAWLVVGKLRFWGCGGAVAAEEALQRAAACARQSGNHHVERESGAWLVANLQDLPIPADAAVGRAEQLLEAAAGDPWAEAAILHAARAALRLRRPVRRRPRGLRRAQSILTGSGAKFDWATSRYAGRPDRADGRGPRRGRAEPAEGIRSAPRDGRARIARDHRLPARRGRLRAGAF